MQGAFGDVLRGTWQGTTVAVKRFQSNFGANYSQAIEEIRHEVLNSVIKMYNKDMNNLCYPADKEIRS